MGIDISLEAPALREVVKRVDAIYAKFGCEHPDTGGMLIDPNDATEAVEDITQGDFHKHVGEIDYDGEIDLDKAIECLQAFKQADLDAYISYAGFMQAIEDHGKDNPELLKIWEYTGPHEITIDKLVEMLKEVG